MFGIAAILRLASSRSLAKGELPTVKTVPKPPATSLRVQFLCRPALTTAILMVGLFGRILNLFGGYTTIALEENVIIAMGHDKSRDAKADRNDKIDLRSGKLSPFSA